jgi:DNA-binding MarR family transcriptional regulator
MIAGGSSAGASRRPYPLGDLLAMARQSWVDQMARQLAELGFSGYRRTDAAVMRMLLRTPVPIGKLGASLGVTRQAARKVVDGLEQRSYVRTERGSHDTRQLNAALTPLGEDYARAVVTVIDELNRGIYQRVTDEQMLGADAVLRAVIGENETWGGVARRLPSPVALATDQG